jgi:hypothetical protein
MVIGVLQFCHAIHIGMEGALNPEGRKKHFIFKRKIKTNATSQMFF